MLDKQQTRQFFSIIGNISVKPKSFDRLFKKVPEIGYQGLLVFLVVSEVDEKAVDELIKLGKRHFGLLAVLIEEKNFNEAYLCSRWESVMPVWNFLKQFNSEHAIHLRRSIKDSGGLKIVHSLTKDLHLSE